MAWSWDWKKALERKLAIDEAMASLIELAHEIEYELGEQPWSLSKILHASIVEDINLTGVDDLPFSESNLSLIDTILTLPNKTLWPMIYTGLAYTLYDPTLSTSGFSQQDESTNKMDPKVFDAFRFKLDKEEDTIEHHGFKKLMELETSIKKDVIKGLYNTNRLSESAMNTLLETIEEGHDSDSELGVFEVGMEVQKIETTPAFLNGPGWPPFAKDDDIATIDRIDESDNTLLLRFNDDKTWWISCALVKPTTTSYN
tara:strand:+ start:216 stop:986 length:771 start_codon:yes stop_codon:yes gene_type:complete